jgi:hypothetical protein
MRRRQALALVALAAAGCQPSSAPTPTAHVEPTPSVTEKADPTPAAPRPDARRLVETDFHFELGGTQVFEIYGDGRARYLYVEFVEEKHQGQRVLAGHWHLAQIQLVPAERGELERVIAAADFYALDDSYILDGIEDGTTKTYTLYGDRGVKRVSCYMRYPPPLEPLRQLLQQIRTAHEPELEKAPEVDAAAAEAVRKAVQ